MPGPDEFIFLLTSPALPLPAAHGLFAYVGLGPGQEFIPYFLALIGFVVTALLAILQRPVAALLRCLPRARRHPAIEQTEGPAHEGAGDAR